MQGTRDHAHDVIVVGSGPGGATVARELSRRGAGVLILEWGPGGPDRGSVTQFLRQEFVPGRSLLVTNHLLAMVRGITTGGSSLFYYATAFPVPVDMLAAHGVDIRADVEEARRELPVAPLKDEMITPLTRRIMDAAGELGFDWRPLDKLIHQERWRPELPFGYYGDPHRVKWTAREFVADAVAHGAAIENHARVTRVVVENGRAAGVEYRQRGRVRQARSDIVVLAAGGIGSPVILRASGITEAGFDFFFDPLITVSGTVRGVAKQANEIPMSTGVLLHDKGYMMTDMAIPRFTHMAFEAQVGRLGSLFAFSSTARIMVKIRDSLGGRVTARGGIRKQLSAKDHATFADGRHNAGAILRHMGARNIHSSWYFAAHPGGTAKIGEVVDAELKTRIDGLHVCDCSVIPEAWGLPPTLTIIALGKYLARHLAGNAPATA